MKYYLITMITNQKGQDAPSIAMYADLEKATIAYHNALASYHNAPDVKLATVFIVDAFGNMANGKHEIVEHESVDTTD